MAAVAISIPVPITLAKVTCFFIFISVATLGIGTIHRPHGYLSMAYILIVDSQAEFRQQLVLQLEKAGHRAAAVATASAATKLIEDEVPDLLVTDGVLSDGSSTSLVQQAEAADAKILMLTGNPDRIVELDGAGQPYVSKPVAPEAFVQRVRQVLGDIEG
jgi:DNA-binding response OmpR family regulator